MSELPAIARSAMTTSAISLAAPMMGQMHAIGRSDLWDNNFVNLPADRYRVAPNQSQTVTAVAAKPTKESVVASPARRLVRVLVVDPDDNVPTDKCLLYSGAEQFTDATDQELFFEIDIRSILEKHNEFRITLTEKGKSEKARKLEPARIRDLKMVVVSLAEF